MRAGRMRQAKTSDSGAVGAFTAAFIAALGGSRRAQHLLQAAGGGALVDLLDGGKLADEAVERCLVDLPLAVGLLGLADIAVEIAHNLGDRSGIARVDLLLVLLRAAAPHGALRPR